MKARDEMVTELKDMSFVQIERLKFIEFRLLFFGELKRSDLMDRFRIQAAAATRDIALYRQKYSKNIEFDTKTKSYWLAPDFTSNFKFKSGQVLSEISSDFSPYSDTRKSELLCEIPVVLNLPEPDFLAVITRAMFQDKILEIEYKSFSSGHTRRSIYPFALVDNGLRWHLRAFDRRRNKFTDFVLTRIQKPQITNENVLDNERKENDIQWNRIVELELVPHQKLKRPEIVTLDYGMVNGVLRVNVRASVAGYLLRRWNVDCSPQGRLDPSLHHLMLRNPQSALYGVENKEIAPGYEEIG